MPRLARARLCPDLLGPGGDKTEFYVFDYCGNMEYFGSNEKVATTQGSGQKSMSERNFVQRLQLVEQLGEGELRSSIIAYLQDQLQNVPANSPLVRPNQRPVLEIYRSPQAWAKLNPSDIAEMEQHLASLPFASASENEYAKRFDHVMLTLQIAAAQRQELTGATHQRVQSIAKNLLTKTNVPEIKLQASLLEDLLSEQWWADASVEDLELVRRNIRGLVQKVDRGQRNAVTMDIADEVGELEVINVNLGNAEPNINSSTVTDRVREFLQKNGEVLVLQKIRSGKKLTATDVDSLEQLVANAAGVEVETLQEELGMPLSLFARTTVGLEETAARAVFADFLADKTLTSVQLRFINQLVSGLMHNGYLTIEDTFEAPYSDNGTVFEVFNGNLARVTDIRDRLEQVKDTAIG